ncbi:hypothetical protein KKA15_00765 [Patescibacteria group bacterium]|nr:hypothetical protein [Patescibacteria group bacterium]
MKLNIKKIKVGLNINIIYKLIYPVMLIVILVGVGFLMIFLYNDIYKTITHAEEVSILRTEVAPEVFQIKTFEGVMENLDQKTTKASIDKSLIKNVFTIPPVEILKPEIQ